MVNQPGVIEDLRTHLSSDAELIDIESVRSYVSSPRLMDFCVRNLDVDGLALVGDSFLDGRTMFADWPQRTFGISLARWEILQDDCEIVQHYDLRDLSVAKLQIWPFDPKVLSDDQSILAVALSYTALEMYAEPRIVGALNDVLADLGFFVDAERY